MSPLQGLELLLALAVLGTMLALAYALPRRKNRKN